MKDKMGNEMKWKNNYKKYDHCYKLDNECAYGILVIKLWRDMSPNSMWKLISGCDEYISKWEGEVCADKYPLKFVKASMNRSRRATNYIITLEENKMDSAKEEMDKILTSSTTKCNLIWFEDKVIHEKTSGIHRKCFYHMRKSGSISPKVLWDNLLGEVSEFITEYRAQVGHLSSLEKKITVLDEKEYNLTDDENVIPDI